MPQIPCRSEEGRHEPVLDEQLDGPSQKWTRQLARTPLPVVLEHGPDGREITITGMRALP